MTMLATKIAGAFLATALVAGGAAAATHVSADDQTAVGSGATVGADVHIDVGLDARANLSGTGDAGQDGIAADGSQTPGTTGECDGDSGGNGTRTTGESDGTGTGTTGEPSDNGTGTTAEADMAGTETTISGTITVEAAGTLDTALGEGGLVVTDLVTNAGFTARVVADTPDAIIVEFTGDGKTTAVLIANVEGSLTAFIDGEMVPVVSDQASVSDQVSVSAQTSVVSDPASMHDQASVDAQIGIDANADLDPELGALLEAWFRLALRG